MSFDFVITEKIIENKMKSLRSDYTICLNGNEKEKAMYPIILYCFSIIDILGTYYTGNACREANTENLEKFLEKYLKYKPHEIKIITELFRHKIVHLSSAKPRYRRDNGKYITWKITWNGCCNRKIVNKSGNITDDFGKIYKIDQIFTFSIQSLIKEIEEASHRYLSDLKKDPQLQAQFYQAHQKIWE